MELCHCHICDAPPEEHDECRYCGEPAPSEGRDKGICEGCLDGLREDASDAARERDADG